MLAHRADLDLGDGHGVGAEDACDRQGEVGERYARLAAHSGSSPPSMLLELYMPGIMIRCVAFCGAEGGGGGELELRGAALAQRWASMRLS